VALDRLFFAHILKSGGTSLHLWIAQNLTPRGVWPAQERSDVSDASRAYVDAHAMMAPPREAIDDIGALVGHCPLATAEIVQAELGVPLTVMTVVRNPVDRVLSHLKTLRSWHWEYRGSTLEEIYEDPWVHPRFFRNHQVKVLGMSAAETMAHGAAKAKVSTAELATAIARQRGAQPGQLVAPSELDPSPTFRETFEAIEPAIAADVPIDDTLLERAKANIAAIDILGVTEQMDTLCATIVERMGWPEPVDLPHARKSPEVDLDPVLRRRIEVDNELDMELYETARAIVAERAPTAHR
jgi:hypothetical protein